jgi:DNA-binding NarL/FixJ family response regulator
MISRLLDDASHDASRSPPVLVIDEDAVASVATLAALADGGFHGTGEASGDAALRHVRASLVRLVVSELYVACAEGPCVVTVLKAERARLPRLQVLIYTRHEREVDVEWALGTGCDALVLKSAVVEVLLREIGRLDGAPARPMQH